MPVLTKINTNSIADDAVTSAKIPTDALGATDIAAGAVGSSEIAADAVGTDELANDVVINTSGAITGTGLTTVSKIVETGGVLKENLLTNSGFDVWSNSGGLFNPTTGAVPAVDDAGSLFQNGDGDSMTGWTDNSGSGSSVGVSGGVFTFDGSSGYGLLTSQACAVTKGSLYQIGYQVTTTSHSSNSAFISTSSNSGNSIATLSEYTDTSTGTRTMLWKSTYTGNVYVTWRTGYSVLRLDNLMMHELIPGCVAADTKGPDGWGKNGGAYGDVWRQSPHATYTKSGSYYSLKMTASGSGSSALVWNYAYSNTGGITPNTQASFLERFAGRTVTMGAWVYATAASKARLTFSDSTVDGSSLDGNSSYHTGGSSWEWLEFTVTVGASPAMISFALEVATSATAYFSQPMLVFGSSIGEGNYTRPKGEVIWFESLVSSDLLDGTGISDNGETTLDLEVDSSGKIPKGIKSYIAELKARDSGSLSNDVWVSLGAGERSMLRLGGITADHIRHSKMWTKTEADGTTKYRRDASGSGTLDVWLYYHGVELH